MSDRDTLVGRIQDETRRTDSGFKTIIEEHVGDAITHFQKTRFYFNDSRDTTFSTVASQRVYTFSGASPDIDTQYYRIDQLILEDSSNDWEMKRLDPIEIERLHDSGSTDNRPYNYCYINQSLILYPTPDAVYTMRIIGHAKLAAPDTGGEANNDWMTEAFDLIRARALWSLHTRVLHEYDKAQIFKADEREALSAMAGATVHKTATGMLMPTQF